MEIISLSGYTAGEKMEIAKRHRRGAWHKANGLEAEQVEVEDAPTGGSSTSYTREAGVRNLEREIGRVLRGRCRRSSSPRSKSDKRHIGLEDIEEDPRAGAVRERGSDALHRAGRGDRPYWTPVAQGDILFIEATRTHQGGCPGCNSPASSATS